MAKKYRFVLTKEIIDSVGDKILVKGVDTNRFEKNPVCLWNHRRDILPIGKWSSIKLNTDTIEADVELDDDDTLAMQIHSKVEKGIINTCSVRISIKAWDYVPPKHDSAGEILENGYFAITECEILETSLVDISANPEATIQKSFEEFKETKEKGETKPSVHFLTGALKSFADVQKQENPAAVIVTTKANETAKVTAKVVEQQSETTAIKSLQETKDQLADRVTELENECTKTSEQLKAINAEHQSELSQKDAVIATKDEAIAQKQADIDKLTERCKSLELDNAMNLTLATLRTKNGFPIEYDRVERIRNAFKAQHSISADAGGNFRATPIGKTEILKGSLPEEVVAFAYKYYSNELTPQQGNALKGGEPPSLSKDDISRNLKKVQDEMEARGVVIDSKEWCEATLAAGGKVSPFLVKQYKL